MLSPRPHSIVLSSFTCVKTTVKVLQTMNVYWKAIRSQISLQRTVVPWNCLCESVLKLYLSEIANI